MARTSAISLTEVKATCSLEPCRMSHCHIVHLAVAGAGIAAGTIDLLHEDAGFGEAEAGAAPQASGISAAIQPALVSASTKATG